MIPIGTLCLLLPPHERAGQFCTVTDALEFNARVWERGRLVVRDAYAIDLASGEVAPPEFAGWAAEPRELLPVAPPGQEYVYRQRIPERV